MIRYILDTMTTVVDNISEFCESLSEIIFRLLDIFIYGILLFLIPIWIIPYLIFKNSHKQNHNKNYNKNEKNNKTKNRSFFKNSDHNKNSVT